MPDEEQATPSEADDRPQGDTGEGEDEDDGFVVESYRDISRGRRRTRLLEDIVFNLANPDAGTVDDDKFFKSIRKASALDLPPQMLEKAQRLCVLLWRKNVRAYAAIELVKDFSIGSGVTFHASDDKVQDLLERHWEVNEWEENLEERIRALAIFGEQMYPAFVNSDTGLVRLSVVNPLLILGVATNPDNADQKVAIKTAVGIDDSELLLRGRDATGGKTFQLIRVDDDGSLTYNQSEPWAFFFAVNRVSGATRGTPDLLSSVDWLEGLDGFVFSMLERAEISQDVVYDITYESATAQEIRRSTKEFTGALRAGGVYGHNEKVKLQILVPDLGASDAETAVRILLRQIQSGTRLAGLFYGDSDDLTRGSASELSVPVAKMIEGRQKFIRRMLTKIFQFQIERAIEAGALEGVEDFRFEIEMPAVFLRDLSTITTALGQLANALGAAVDQKWLTNGEARALFRMAVTQIGPTSPEAAEAEEEEKDDDVEEAARPFDFARVADGVYALPAAGQPAAGDEPQSEQQGDDGNRNRPAAAD